MKCVNCKTEFNGRNFGSIESVGRVITVADICSQSCRSAYIKKPARDPPPAGNAGNGVKVRKPLTAAAIKKKLRPSEAEISRALAADLDARGIWNTRTQSGAIKTASGHVMKLCRQGTPDRIATPGLHVWIEVKKPGELPTADQRAIMAELRDNGGLAFVIDDPEDLTVILDCLKTREPGIRNIRETILTIQGEIDRAIFVDRERRDRRK